MDCFSKYKKKATLWFKAGNHELSWVKHTLCVVHFSALYVSHISKLQMTKMQSYNIARLANVSHIQAMKDWLLYCTSRGCSSCFPRQGRGDWNEFFILASFQGQIAYWFHFFVYYGGLVHAKIGLRSWRLPISQCWLILCSLWPATPNQG